MLKAKATTEGKESYIFGLSRSNTERLLAGESMTFNLGSIGGPDIIIYIMAGETEKDMAGILHAEGGITEETVIISSL